MTIKQYVKLVVEEWSKVKVKVLTSCSTARVTVEQVLRIGIYRSPHIEITTYNFIIHWLAIRSSKTSVVVEESEHQVIKLITE